MEIAERIEALSRKDKEKIKSLGSALFSVEKVHEALIL